MTLVSKSSAVTFSFLSQMMMLTASRSFMLKTYLSFAYKATQRKTCRALSNRFVSPRRNNFYSIDDLDASNRTIPPTLDSFAEDEGFGAFQYQPDLYDNNLFLDDYDRSGTSQLRTTKGNSLDSTTDQTAPCTEESKASELPRQMGPMYSDISEPVPRSHELNGMDTLPALTHAAEADEDWVRKASSGQINTNEISSLEQSLKALEQDIYQQNNGNQFNIQSPKQLSEVLYGVPGQTTNKETLEAMAGGGNRMASLVLQYRDTKQKIKRLARKLESAEKGTLVRSASTVKRNDETQSADPLLLVDASAYIFRAYYSMPPIHRSDGLPTGAVMGFCNMLNRLVLNRLIGGETPRLVLVFDAKGKTFRHERYNQYKANRAEAPMDLIPQFALIREAAIAYGIPQIEAPSYEADDVIATLSVMATSEGIDTNILSGDKDLMQLISPEGASPCVSMIDPMTMSRVTSKEVYEKWAVQPEGLGDVLALCGDTADNVPGVKGIGPKIAASLINDFGSLANLLENIQSVKQKSRREKLLEGKDLAILSRELVELVRDVPLERMTFPHGYTKISELYTEQLDPDRLLDFYDRMGFRDLKRRVGNQLKNRQTKRPQSRMKTQKVDVPKPEDFKDVPF